jgi:DNA-binding beta-propeller fold protein YncE
MSFQLLGYIELPPHVKAGGFDHAAVHTRLNRLYVAHTANDALDVIDCEADRYVRSIPGLAGIAGALVSEDSHLVFTSNRGENTVALFPPDDEAAPEKIQVGVRPNGLAYDSRSGLLLVAHVGDPAVQGSQTVMLIDVRARRVIATIPVPGRTRWAVFDDQSNAFFVNIADPPMIVVVNAAQPAQIARTYPVPASGPHGLDIDTEKRRLFCACDGGKLVTLDNASGEVLQQVEIGGVPDVIFFNAALHHLYVAIGVPGIIEVFDTITTQRIEAVKTEMGAHTLAFDVRQNKVYAFLPQSHRSAVYLDTAT